MDEGFQRHILSAAATERIQWRAAILAALIAGGVLLLFPGGSPWSALSIFSSVVMGRSFGAYFGWPLPLSWLLHLLISVPYGLAVSAVAAHFRKGRAVVAGVITGGLLYALNLGLVSILWPHLRGNEGDAVLAHLLFGAIAAGAYRGLLNRGDAPVTR